MGPSPDYVEAFLSRKFGLLSLLPPDYIFI